MVVMTGSMVPIPVPRPGDRAVVEVTGLGTATGRDLSICRTFIRSSDDFCGRCLPETAHRLTLTGLSLGIGGRSRLPDPPALRQRLLGLDFPNR